MATKASFKHAISLDDECERIVEKVVKSGKALNFTDGIRYCIRAQKERKA
jgi:hypothetical protein